MKFVIRNLIISSVNRNNALAFCFVLFAFAFHSQVYTYQSAKKFHYEINSSENDSINKRINQAAFDYVKFDELRFLDERRVIPIKGYNASLLLYSANELLEKYGKQISPFTILPNNYFDAVELTFTDNKFPTFMIIVKD
jgi:hypothetical protein